jgi:disulfide bond formation protein DsbB
MDFLKDYTFTIVDVLSALTVIGQLISVLLLLILLQNMRKGVAASSIGRWVSEHGLLLMFVIACISTLGSLFLSEVAGWNPCKLCWFQRIVMYPQLVMLVIALWRRDRGVAPYLLALSLIGLAIAAYHYVIQLQNIVASPLNPATPCDASGESCVKTPFIVFGYVTIPLMAFTAFVLNALGSVFVIRSRR